METLTRAFLQNSQQNAKNRPEKILQFGEGNFLRAFVDYFIDEINTAGLFDGGITVVQPIAQGLTNMLNAQDGCYTVILRGLENKKQVVKKKIVTSINRAIDPYKDYASYLELAKNPDLRYIVSNTTEAGITFVESDKLSDAPPVSFPAKVTSLLYERYRIFNGDPTKGFIFIPCELIDYNGAELKKTILRYAAHWKMPLGFADWIESHNHFTNTLVDRIVTGYPRDEIEKLTVENGYKDDLLVTGEIFHFFAIEADAATALEMEKTLPFAKAGLNVVLTSDATPYKLRKVRILNGGHTMSVLAAYLCGCDTVGEMMDNTLFHDFLHKGIYDEIIPTLDLSKEDLESFAASVFDRFANPYIKHYLLSISLNSVAKFKARVLPTILEYHKRKNELPIMLTASFAALIAFYKGGEIISGSLIGSRNGEEYKITDDMEVLEYFKTAWQTNNIEEMVRGICAKQDFWGTDLNTLPGFAAKVAEILQGLLQDPTAEVKKLLKA